MGLGVKIEKGGTERKTKGSAGQEKFCGGIEAKKKEEKQASSCRAND